MHTALLNPTSPEWGEVVTALVTELRFRFVRIAAQTSRMPKDVEQVLLTSILIAP